MLVGLAPLVRPWRAPGELSPGRGGEEVEHTEAGEAAMRHVRHLAGEIGVRQAGTEGERQAARYIAQVMRDQGYEVVVQAGIPVRDTGWTTENVIAWQGGGEGLEAIVLGAHYDSRVGEEASPGANDNASGVAVLLEVARELKGVKLGCEVTYAFFGAEEVGYVGARGYVGRRGSPPGPLSATPGRLQEGGRTATARPKTRIAAMVEVDMVGVGERLRLNYVSGANEVGRELQEAGQVVGVRLDEQEGNGRSDHEAFARVGVPAVWIERSPDEANHTKRDTVARVRAEKLQEVVDLVATWMMERRTAASPLRPPVSFPLSQPADASRPGSV